MKADILLHNSVNKKNLYLISIAFDSPNILLQAVVVLNADELIKQESERGNNSILYLKGILPIFLEVIIEHYKNVDDYFCVLIDQIRIMF